MKKVLVTGADGFVGAHLLRSASASHWQVHTLERDRFESSKLAVDRDSSDRHMVQALRGLDVIIHLAGVAHRHATEDELAATNQHWPVRLYAAAVSAEVPRFIWLSSIKVLGETSTVPLTVDAPYAPVDAYGRSKAEAERALLDVAEAGATELAIVRPPLVYGPGVKANFLLLLKLARLNRLGLPLPLGAADAPRSFVGVHNLIDLIGNLCDTGSGIFHVTDPEDLSVSELLKRLGGRPGLMLPVPRTAMRQMARLTGQQSVYQRLFEPLQLDQSATQAELGWQPPFAVGQQLDETMAWYRRAS